MRVKHAPLLSFERLMAKTLTINDSLSTVCPTGYRFDPILTACICDITQHTQSLLIKCANLAFQLILIAKVVLKIISTTISNVSMGL